MTLRTLTLMLAAGLTLGAATQASAQAYAPYPPMPVADDSDAVPDFPWYLDPEEVGPLYAYDGDTTRPAYTYAGDENAGDFADRYGCKPVWDGGVNRYVAACNTH